MSLRAPLHAVVTVDDSGRIVEISADAEVLFGLDAASTPGRAIAGLVDAGVDAIERAGELRTTIARADGTPVPVQASFHRLASGGVLIVREVSDQQLTDEVQGMLAAVFDTTPMAAAMFNTDGEYIRVNGNLCRLLGRTDGELIGRRDQEFTHPDDRASDLEGARRILAGELNQWQTEKRFVRPDGTIVWAIANMTFLRDSDGCPLCWVGQFQDITDRRAIEERLRQRERQLAEAQAVAKVGSWVWEVIPNRLEWSDELCRLFGRDAGDPPATYDDYLASVDVADRERVDRLIADAQTTHQPFEFEHELRRTDGSVAILHCRGKVEVEDGVAVRMLGTAQDVTDARRVRNELERSREEQQALREIAELVADAAAEAVVFSAAAKHVRDLFGASGGAVAQFDAAAGVARLRSVWTETEGTPPGTAYTLEGDGLLAAVLSTGRPARRDELQPPAELTVTAAPIGAVAAPIVVTGRVWGALIASFAGHPAPEDAEERLGRFADLVAMAVANTEAWDTLAREAATDSVTGLANHRTFHDRLRGEVQRAGRYERALSLVLLDLDHFKFVNDTYGHQAGDQVLAAVGRLLSLQARDGELVARIGGEEFAWLMPEADRHAAYRAAERVRRRIELEDFPYAGRITVSAGVATSEAGDLVADELIRHADRALYWAKDDGRNTTFVYSEETRELLSERSQHAAQSRAMASVRALAHAIDSKDPGTRQHSERVATLAQRLALWLGWTTKRAQLLHDCGLLHDIGKIGIADDILFKRGPLTPAEHAQLKRHAEVSALIASEVLEHEQVTWIRSHHERWDGLGYPDQLSGEQIPDGAQLLAVADAYDAMTEIRTHEQPKTPAEALAECQAKAGTQFAPVAVTALVAISLPGGDERAAPAAVGFGPSWAGQRQHSGIR